jgi:hypothetical protein
MTTTLTGKTVFQRQQQLADNQNALMSYINVVVQEGVWEVPISDIPGSPTYGTLLIICTAAAASGTLLEVLKVIPGVNQMFGPSNAQLLSAIRRSGRNTV